MTIEWHPQADAYLEPHERDAIERGLPHPGHDLADDERGPAHRCGRGELVRKKDGTIVVVTRDGHHRIVGTTEPDPDEPEIEVSRDLGEPPNDAPHAHDELRELAQHLADENLALRARLAALESKSEPEPAALESKPEPEPE